MDNTRNRGTSPAAQRAPGGLNKRNIRQAVLGARASGPAAIRVILPDLQRLVEENPEWYPGWELLGDALIGIGPREIPEALKAYETSLQRAHASQASSGPDRRALLARIVAAAMAHKQQHWVSRMEKLYGSISPQTQGDGSRGEQPAPLEWTHLRARNLSVFDIDLPVGKLACPLWRDEGPGDLLHNPPKDANELQQRQVKLTNHLNQDCAYGCRSILTSREVAPFVDEFLAFEWNTSDSGSIRFTFQTIKGWIRGIQQDDMPLPLFITALTKRFPQISSDLNERNWNRKVVVPILILVKLIDNLIENSPPFSAQDLNLRLVDDRWIYVDLHGDGIHEYPHFPSARGRTRQGSTTAQLKRLLDWSKVQSEDTTIAIDMRFDRLGRILSFGFELV